MNITAVHIFSWNPNTCSVFHPLPEEPILVQLQVIDCI